jgi:hypothetical protein
MVGQVDRQYAPGMRVTRATGAFLHHPVLWSLLVGCIVGMPVLLHACASAPPRDEAFTAFRNGCLAAMMLRQVERKLPDHVMELCDDPTIPDRFIDAVLLAAELRGSPPGPEVRPDAGAR